MSASPSAQNQVYQPTTFLERGVTVPFTTPALCAARARPAERGGLELLVPNPAGGRGMYILPWAGVRELCRPTVHDTRLNDRITQLRGVTPGAIRLAARQVAAEGLAGRQAAAAASQEEAAETQERLVANFRLLLRLVQQIEPSDAGAIPAERERPAALEERAKLSIARVAPRLGLPPDAVAAALEELAGVFAGLGVGAEAERARIPVAIGQIAALQAELDAWCADRAEDAALAAQAIAGTAALTVTCATATLADARAMLSDLPLLLARWTRDPDVVATPAARPEWLIDGWDHVLQLWRASTDATTRRALLPEMLLVAPIVPKEVKGWTRLEVDTEGPLISRRTVLAMTDWRTGGAVSGLRARRLLLRGA
jgi:hypothetical protein